MSELIKKIIVIRAWADLVGFGIGAIVVIVLILWFLIRSKNKSSL